MKILNFLILFLLSLFYACSNESDIQQGELSLSILEKTLNGENGRIESVTPEKIVISIEKITGESVFDEEIFDITPFGSGYSVDPILLQVGDYIITKFLVLSVDQEIVYATPIVPSSLAGFVENPLPIGISIQSDKVTQMPLEVISTSGLDPEDLGYASLTFNIVPTQEILLGVFENTIQGYQLTKAELTLYGDLDSIFTISLGDSINVIKVRSDYTQYDFLITKDRYSEQLVSINNDELNQYRTKPIEVLFNDLIEGLVAYYPFTGNSSDISGNELHGQVLGASLSMDRFGQENSAYFFDGINDRIEVKYNDLLALQEFTISAWIKAEKDTGAIITFSDFSPVDNNCGYYFGLLDGHLRGTNNYSGYNWVSNTSDEIITLNEWHHIAYTFDGQYMTLYLDGEEISKIDSPHTVNYSERNNIQLGTYATQAGGTWFHGLIDEIRIYNNSLQPVEIKSLSQIL